MPPDRKPPCCNGCVHYFITHDAQFRFGCRALAFKSRQQPVLEVVQASGGPCLFFLPKERRAG